MARGRPASRPAGADQRLVELTRRLGAVLSELGLTEVEVETGDVRVRVQRAAVHATAAPAAVPAATPMLAPAPTVAAERPLVADVEAERLVTVEAPMVGTFYRAPSPTADPYVREGDVIKEGQILCIIEAMKLMNEIEAKVAGRITRILVENGQPVEYGQPLFLVDPHR